MENNIEKKRYFLFLPKTLKYLFLTLIVVVSLGPVFWVLMSSFKTYNELNSSAISLPSHFMLDNYITALDPKQAPILKFFLNSVIVCSANTFIVVFVVSACAYVVARFNFKMKKLIVMLISASLLLPAQALSQPIFVMLNKMNLFDTKIGLILVYGALGIPITFFIMRSFFLSIPRAIEEAAYIDGADFLSTFVKIVLPLAKPGMITAAILQFMSTWNEFYFALMLTSGSKARTIPIALNYFMSAFGSNYSALFAAVIITIIPTIIVFIMGQNQIIDSLTAGAVKG